MRLATWKGQPAFVDVVDGEIRGALVGSATEGLFPEDSIGLLDRWDELLNWYGAHEIVYADPVREIDLGPPVVAPRQIFAVGMNYTAHAKEVNIDLPSVPSVFTKYTTSLAGASAVVELSSSMVDWEVELVAVVGQRASGVSEDESRDVIAGYMVGQDLSDRSLQFASADMPQFSLSKSFKGYAPTGPWITPAGLVEYDEGLVMRCAVNGLTVQEGSTKNLVFDVFELVRTLSAVVELLPGDLIFTGTPAGVGHGMVPPRYLKPGDRLHSSIEGLGSIKQVFV